MGQREGGVMGQRDGTEGWVNDGTEGGVKCQGKEPQMERKGDRVGGKHGEAIDERKVMRERGEGGGLEGESGGGNRVRGDKE